MEALFDILHALGLTGSVALLAWGALLSVSSACGGGVRARYRSGTGDRGLPVAGEWPERRRA